MPGHGGKPGRFQQPFAAVFQRRLTRIRAVRIVHISDQNEPATVDSEVFPWPLFLFPATSSGTRPNCGDSVPTIRESATPELNEASRASGEAARIEWLGTAQYLRMSLCFDLTCELFDCIGWNMLDRVIAEKLINMTNEVWFAFWSELRDHYET